MRRRRMIFKASSGQIVNPSMDYNQAFGLKQIVSGYMGALIRLYNGVSTVTYGFIDVGIVNDFLAAGNGTNEIVELFDQKGGQSWLFNTGTAPSLFLESDGSYSMQFTPSQGSDNGILFIGNMINIVYTSTGSHVLLSSSTGSYLACAHPSMWYISNGNTGSLSLYNGNTSITNNRVVLYPLVTSGFKCINYRNVSFSTSLWKIARYSSSGWFFSGRIKEIFTRTMTNNIEDNNSIQQSITRNNL